MSAPATLLFGDYVKNTVAEETLTVGNAAWDPGEELDYSMSTGVGFTVPGGSFLLGPGETNDHTVEMDTGSEGDRYDTVTITSNDVDDPDRNQLYWDHEEELIADSPHRCLFRLDRS